MGDDIIAFVPLLIVLSIATIPIAAQYFAFRRRKAALDVARECLQERDTIDEKVIKALVQDDRPPFRDLRSGALFLGLAIAGVGFSFALDGSEARSILRAATLFPLILGLTHLGFHFLNRNSTGVE